MSDYPNGNFDDFDESSEGKKPDNDPAAQFRDFLQQFGLTGGEMPVNFEAMVSQVQRAFQAAGIGEQGTSNGASPICWAKAKQAARAYVAANGPDPAPSAHDQRVVADSVRLSESWLDAVTSFRQATSAPIAWSRAEWIENTMDSWRTIAEPIATNIADSLVNLASDTSFDDGDVNSPNPAASLMNLMSPLLRDAAGSIYATHLVEAIGGLALQVLTGTEIGLQMLPHPQIAVLPANVETFGEGLGFSTEDLLLHLCTREAARQRLFASVPWLASQLLALLEHYAREITIDSDALRESMSLGDLDELTPEKLEEESIRLQGRLFSPKKTPEQEAILERLETLLALIESWVDTLTFKATTPWMPNSAALAETIRRRQAIGGPAEKAFQALVGLDLRPRRRRDAANLWAALEDARGAGGRDAVWAHPDLIPTTADLDDPLGYVSGEGSNETDELDTELARILREHDAGYENPEADGK